MSNYDFTLELEVLREISANIVAKFSNFMDKYHIDEENENNKYAKKYWELVDLREEMYYAKSIDELNQIEHIFIEAEKMLNKRPTIRFKIPYKKKIMRLYKND